MERVLAAALQPATAEGQDKGAVALALLRGMKDRSEMARLVRKPEVMEAILDLMWGGAESLNAAEAATTAELHDKFVTDGKGFNLNMGNLSTFFGGLEALVGSPSAKIFLAMLREHCNSADWEEFLMPNKKAKTTSAIEWRFVVCPEDGADGNGASFVPYPNAAHAREPLPFATFEPLLEERNKRLEALDQPPVGREEFFAARLYTGPVCAHALLRTPRTPERRP